MIGKIKSLNSNHLLYLVSFFVLVTSYIFENYILIFVYSLFFFISLLTTKYGLKIIKELKLFQNIRTEGPSLHESKKNTPKYFLKFLIRSKENIEGQLVEI